MILLLLLLLLLITIVLTIMINIQHITITIMKINNNHNHNHNNNNNNTTTTTTTTTTNNNNNNNNDNNNNNNTTNNKYTQVRRGGPPPGRPTETRPRQPRRPRRTPPPLTSTGAQTPPSLGPPLFPLNVCVYIYIYIDIYIYIYIYVYRDKTLHTGNRHLTSSEARQQGRRTTGRGVEAHEVPAKHASSLHHSVRSDYGRCFQQKGPGPVVLRPYFCSSNLCDSRPSPAPHRLCKIQPTIKARPIGTIE